ncbi:hypothetical protein P3342_001086 [Pyrenophora teres f. teres]|nr:hypothetical protein P3342_001086 [Pyrenophora teres f. teres]
MNGVVSYDLTYLPPPMLRQGDADAAPSSATNVAQNGPSPDNAAVPSGSRKTSSGVPSKSSVEPHLWIFSLQSVSVALPQFKTNFATLTSVSIAAAKSSHRSTMEGAKDSGARCVMRDIGGSSCDAVAVSWRFVGIVVCIVSESGKT